MPLIHIDMEALRRDLAALNLEHECDCANRIGFEAWMRLRTNRAHAEFMRRTDALSNPPRRYASGGIVTGMRLVGESGPELIDFRQPARTSAACMPSAT